MLSVLNTAALPAAAAVQDCVQRQAQRQPPLRPLVLAATRIEIGRAEFGLFEDDRLVPARTVPLRLGQVYGWRICLWAEPKMVHVREEFELPRAPRSWGFGADKKISPDGRVSTSESDMTVRFGMIEKRWEVAEGDPAGPYKITVSIDGLRAALFEFNAE